MELCWIRGEFAVCRLAPDHIPKIRLDREFVFLQKTDQRRARPAPRPWKRAGTCFALRGRWIFP